MKVKTACVCWIVLVVAMVRADAGRPDTLTAVEKSAIDNYFNDQLRDPESARYTFDVVKRTGDAIIVCGTVNAKNGYGGYVGRQSFFSFIENGGVHGLIGGLPVSEGLAVCKH
jgi:hypothetical protein